MNSKLNCLNMTIANQKILKCSNCRKNYEIYRQKYEKKTRYFTCTT